MKKHLTILIAACSGILHAQNMKWQTVLKGENQFNPSLNKSALAADVQGYWVQHLTKQKMSYGSEFLGEQEIMHLDKSGVADDTLRIHGKGGVRFLQYVNGGLYIWVSCFDSCSFNEFNFVNAGNYKRYLCLYKDEALQYLGAFDDTIETIRLLSNGKMAALSTGGFGGGGTLTISDPDGKNAVKKFIPGLGFAQEITEATDGGIFITGGCMAEFVKFDNIDVHNPFTYSNYVMYFDSKMKGNWMRFIEDITCVSSVAAGSGSDAFWTGSTYSRPAFDSLVYSGAPTMSFNDFFATRISNTKFEWVKEIPSDTTYARITMGFGNTIGVDGMGNCYAIGTVSGFPIHWNAQLTTGNSKNSSDIILASWASDGSIRWIYEFGGKANEQACELIVNGVDDLLFSAVLTDSFSQDGNEVQADYGDVWVVKLGEDQTNAQKNIRKNNLLKFYPNPGTGWVQHNAGATEAYQLFDVSGKLLNHGILLPGKALDFRSLSPGTYFIKTAAGTTMYMKAGE